VGGGVREVSSGFVRGDVPAFRTNGNEQALWPFQGFDGVSNARVNRMFMEEPAAESETTTAEEDAFGTPVLLGKGTWTAAPRSSICSPPLSIKPYRLFQATGRA